MTNELTANPTALGVWESEEELQKIRTAYAPQLSEREFELFVSLGRATGLNPFLRELWAVKYSGKPQMFIGRDGYRKSAQRHPLYDYHTSDAVYSNDKYGYDVTTGMVGHIYGDLNNRGQLIGAYALAQRKGSSRPAYVFAELKEYDSKQALWLTKPATMIKKVAEAQALRACFQELFAGTYDEAEDWRAQQVRVAMENPQKGINGLREKLGLPILKKAPVLSDDDELNAYTDYSEKDFTYDAIVHMIKGSLNLEELKASGDLAKNFSTEERESLRPIYEQRRNELKAQFINMENAECHTHSHLNQ